MQHVKLIICWPTSLKVARSTKTEQSLYVPHVHTRTHREIIINHHCHTDTPLKLKDLNVVYEALYNARSKWEDIGLELNVDPEALISISRNQSEHAECLKEMLSFRLRFPTSGVLTWKLIIESLRANFVAQNDLANAIENSLT